jgi:hypothetical protein
MDFGYFVERINCRSVKERSRFERNKEINCGVGRSICREVLLTVQQPFSKRRKVIHPSFEV